MPGASASASEAVRQAGIKTSALLFPFSIKRWLSIYLGQFTRAGRNDPAVAELLRLSPYYHGTTLLSYSVIFLIVIGFTLPFSVIYVGLEGFLGLLIVYMLLLIVLSIAGIGLEVVLDAIFAIRHEEHLSFFSATRRFIALARKKTSLAIGYMAVKLIADMTLMTAVLVVFTPALLGAMAVMVYIIQAIRAGTDVQAGASIGLVIIGLLTMLGFAGGILITLTGTAFYGYYTETAVRMLRE